MKTILKAYKWAKGMGWRFIKRLADSNYYVAKAYYRLCLNSSSARDQEPLIVYQMGKVGSMTVIKSLKAAKSTEASIFDVPIYHVHALTDGAMREMERFFRRRFTTPSHRSRASESVAHSQELHRQAVTGLHHVWTCRYLRRLIDEGPKGKRWKVVTLVRDPIARNVSSFFHLLDYDLEYKDKFAESGALDGGVELFLEEYDQHDEPLTWYDSELKPVFGIDVFSSDFPKSKGYEIYEGERADVLLLKVECLNDCVRDAFKEFLGIDDFALIQANVARRKSYGAAYRRFLDSVAIPEHYMDRMYGSKYAQHFYSEEEINAFRAKWRGSVTPEA